MTRPLWLYAMISIVSALLAWCWFLFLQLDWSIFDP